MRSKWLTWEAQKGKSQLDTHFSYLNKQLAKDCLEGEINYIDPHKTFDALCYKGGARATTTILVEQLEGAQTMSDLSKAVFTDREGINFIHNLTFEADKITDTFFLNINRGKKVYQPEDLWPSLEGPVGNAIKGHANDGEPLFFPFKEMLAAEDDKEWARQIDMHLLPLRVYKYFTKHWNDASFASQPVESNSAAREHNQRKMEELREILEEAFDLQELNNEMTPLHKLDKLWAQKKNGTYLALSDEVADKLAQMLMARQGTKNKAL
jgi:hypothetical protein